MASASSWMIPALDTIKELSALNPLQADVGTGSFFPGRLENLSMTGASGHCWWFQLETASS